MMLEEINELMKSTNESERAFEELRDKNEDEIKLLIKSSEAYQELQKECVEDYKCFISILSRVEVSICYKLYENAHKQSLSVYEDGIEDTRNHRAWQNQRVANKLNHLATKFYEEFYLEKKQIKDIW